MQNLFRKVNPLGLYPFLFPLCLAAPSADLFRFKCRLVGLEHDIVVGRAVDVVDSEIVVVRPGEHVPVDVSYELMEPALGRQVSQTPRSTISSGLSCFADRRAPYRQLKQAVLPVAVSCSLQSTSPTSVHRTHTQTQVRKATLTRHSR